MTASLTRVVGFHALHRIYPETGSHGHDYQGAVTVSGPLEASGMIVDLALLDRILSEEVVKPTTCEAMATYLFGRLAPRLPAGVVLDRVRIAEDATLYGDCTRTT